MEKIIGIDLGTTNSVVSILENGIPLVITDPKGEKLVPSMVGLSSEGNLVIGTEAFRQYIAVPEATVKSVKRKMGTEHRFHLQDQSFSAQEISSLIIKKLKSQAEEFLGMNVNKAVITVPAYFSDAQRQATKKAGELAGLEVSRILNEPTAAALVYNRQAEKNETVLVYDLGGGTFDVSLVEIVGEVTEVLASHGNNMLGGDDFDRVLQNWLVQEFEKEHRVDLRSNFYAMSRLNRVAEDIKIRLSEYSFVEVREEFLAKKGETPLHLSLTISREIFEELIQPLLEKTMDSIDQILEDAKLNEEDLDKIILVGGSTRIPLVSKLLESHMDVRIYTGIDPDFCVAMGAAYQGGILNGEKTDSILVDVTPYSLGVSAVVQDWVGYNPYYFSVIIPRNTVVPVSRSDTFSNLRENQRGFDIEIYQGEQEDVRENIYLGDFSIEGLPATGRGELKLEIHFHFDANGILEVTAQNYSYGKKESISLSLSNSELSPSQQIEVKDRLEEIWSSQEESEVTFLSDQQDIYNRFQEVKKKNKSPEEIENLESLIESWKKATQAEDHKEVDRLTAELLETLYFLEEL